LSFNKKRIIVLIFAISYLLAFTFNVSANVTVTAQQINFKLDDKPNSNIKADKMISFKRIESEATINNKSIYYNIGQLENAKGEVIDPEYILARTPYRSTYQSFNNSVFFLARNDTKARVKFKLAKEVWNKVSSGVYKGWLQSVNGQSIRVIVRIKPYINVAIEPPNIKINAETGPGVYKAKDKVTVRVEANHPNWNLRIYAEPLIYEGDNSDEVRKISPEKLLMALDGEDGSYSNLASGIEISGSNYRRGRIFDAFFKAKVGWEDTAGMYRGKVYFTITKSKSLH
jgi:hypothetical protein